MEMYAEESALWTCLQKHLYDAGLAIFKLISRLQTNQEFIHFVAFITEFWSLQYLGTHIFTCFLLHSLQTLVLQDIHERNDWSLRLACMYHEVLSFRMLTVKTRLPSPSRSLP